MSIDYPVASSSFLPYNEGNNFIFRAVEAGSIARRWYFGLVSSADGPGKGLIMDIEGTYTLQASPEDVWQGLMDRRIVRHATPGLEQLEVQDQHTYTVAMHIKHAPLKGTYHGRVTISDREYPRQYRIRLEGEGQQGPVTGEGLVRLDSSDENTVVVYKGTLTFGKSETASSTSLARGALKLLLQQFFLALAEQLRTTKPGMAYRTAVHHPLALREQPPDHTSIPAPTTDQQTRLQAIVHQLHLGGDDPIEEEQWVRRLRRAGIAAALLFLVWIGTRLPRR